MNANFDEERRNNYEGNGWSKYQIMVLQQLEDHNEVLHNLNKEVVDIKQTMAVSETESKIWRTTAMSDINSLNAQMKNVLYEDSGLSKRIFELEKETEFKLKNNMRSRALWAAVGAAAVALIDIILKFLTVIK